MELKAKLNCILLIDDDEYDNFYHEKIIYKIGVAKKVVALESGIEALEYLASSEKEICPTPDLIFLDVNMPGLDGWGFLEKYNSLSTVEKDKIVLIMLTTSDNPRDKVKVQSIPNVSGYENKPLNKDILQEIIHKKIQKKE